MAVLKDYENAVDGIVNIAITLVIGIVVVSQLQSLDVIPTLGNTAINELLTTLGDIPAWVAIVIVVVLATGIRKMKADKKGGNY